VFSSQAIVPVNIEELNMTDDKDKVETRRKIREYQRDLLNWLYGDEDNRGDDRQLHDMYIYEDQGDQ